MPCESLGTHGGGWGKAKLDKIDKSGALQGGDRASSGIAFLGPSRAPFRILLLGREGSKQTLFLQRLQPICPLH